MNPEDDLTSESPDNEKEQLEESTTKIDGKEIFTKKEKKALEKSYKPVHLIGFPARRVDTIFYGENNKPVAFIQTRKIKPYTQTVKILPKLKKRNPDKKVLASVGHFPNTIQIFTYKNNPAYIYIYHGQDMIKMEIEDFMKVLNQAFQSTMEDKTLFEQFIMSAISLTMGMSKLPHLKFDLSKYVKEFNVDVEFLKQSNEKEKVWK